MLFLEPFILFTLAKATVVGKVQINPTKCQVDYLLQSGNDIVTQIQPCELK